MMDDREPIKSPWHATTVGRLIEMLSGIPRDITVHIDLGDNHGNVWKGDVDGWPVVNEDECWLQAGFVYHQTPEETLELADDDEDDGEDDEDDGEDDE